MYTVYRNVVDARLRVKFRTGGRNVLLLALTRQLELEYLYVSELIRIKRVLDDGVRA